MYFSYMLYQAGRIPSRTEQRAIDAQRGELARTLASLLRWRRRAADEATPGAAGVIPDYVPPEWASAPFTSSSVSCPKSA
jgi:hypothetical protein